MAEKFDWDKYPAQGGDTNSGFDWNKYPQEKPKKPGIVETAARFGVQGAAGGLADEIYGGVRAFADDVKKAVSGDTKRPEVKRDEFGRITNLDEINAGGTYEQHRDEYRQRDKDAREANPTTAFVAEMAGGIASPLNKVTKGMSAVKGGAVLGGVYGYGNSESDTLAGQAVDTLTGAALGAGGGKVAEKAAPYIDRGIQKGAQAIQNVKTKVGNAAKNASEEWAFKSTGAMLKDWRNADDRGEVNKIGRWLLDKGLKAGQTVDDVAAIGAREKEAAAVILDDVYNKAGSALKGGGEGFDPIRDKERIMAAARSELGDTVGGEGVLNQLSSYIDDLALKHGDAPNDVLRKQFQADLQKYKGEYRRYLKERKEYQNAFGQAADDQQQMLQGFHDDSQRAVGTTREVEVPGRPAEVMTPEGFEYGTQMDLLEMPNGNMEAQRLFARPGDANFGAMGGDAADRLGKKAVDALEGPAQIDFLNNNTNQMILNESAQANIQGTGLVPRTMRQVDDVGVRATGDQLRMNFQPNAPVRPVAPAEVRNPMAPRRANEIKGAFDEQINYSRNPLAKEPAKEMVYSGARKELNNIILESIDSIDDKAIGEALRQANSDYGMASKVSRIANDRVQRENANKFFGLTDNITGVGGVVASLMTGTPLTGLALVGVKKAADKYGATTAAVALDGISKRLLRQPQMQRLAQVNPQQFNATVIRLFETMEARGQLRIPKAAENDRPTKGPEKWVLDGIDKLNQAGITAEELEALRSTKQGRNLLIEASDASPGSKRMESVLRRIRTATAQGGQ